MFPCRAYALVLKFSTYVLCDIYVIGTETSVLLMGSMNGITVIKAPKRHAVAVARREIALYVRHSDSIQTRLGIN